MLVSVSVSLNFKMSQHTTFPTKPHGNELSHGMVTNCAAFLIQGGLWLWGVLEDWHVVSINVALSKATPIILSLFLGPLSVSTPIFMATNSALKTPVLIVTWHLECQSTMTLDCVDVDWDAAMECLVWLSSAWLLSVDMHTSTGLPKGFGGFGGMGSVALPWNSF